MLFLKKVFKAAAGRAMLLLALSAGLAEAAPVDLTPPRNSLGYSDKDGYFRMVERFGQLRFSGGFVIPLRFEFWTGREDFKESSPYGWDGWHCGPLESTVSPYGGDRILEVTLLCAKRLYLERDAAAPGLFHSPDREWTGRTEGDRLLISREDGWELVFRDGRVERLRTDHGATIVWLRDETGRLLSIAEEGADAPALEVKWKGGDSASGLVEALAMPDRTVSVEVRPVRGAGRSLFRVSWPEGESVQESRMEHDARSLDVSNRLGMTRRFEWDTDTGRILSDGVNTYDVAVGEGGSSTVRMVNASGEEQTRRYDNAGNAIVATRPDGFVSTLYRVPDADPGAPGIARIEFGTGDEGRVVMRNHYDSAGRVVRREWAGDPVGWTGYRGGRIEPALDPSSEATYPLPEGAAPAVDASLATVSFDYDEEGRHVASRVGDQVVLRLDYGPEGKVVRAERTGRFVRAWSYAEGKVVETLELPGLPEGPYGFVGSGDPGVTGDLVVRRESVPGGPALLEVYLDGTSRRLSYDGRGRLSGEERFGRDTSSPALSIRYVYSPDGSRVGEIEDNRLAGKTSYYQRPVQADGLWGHREKVARLAFP